MRPPADITAYLTVTKMFNWLQDAPDESSYKRRLAIWLTHTGKLHAHKVAEILGVSTQAVWLWISQYNRHGPAGLKRTGRGGRRWGFLTPAQEAELLRPFIRRARTQKRPQAREIRGVVERRLGRKVSKAYVYRLLQRHGWGRIIAESRSLSQVPASPDSFQRLSQPWLRSG